MRPQKRPQDYFRTYTHMIYHFVFFLVAESISAMFKWIRVKVAAQSCVKAAGGRQNINSKSGVYKVATNLIPSSPPPNFST